MRIIVTGAAGFIGSHLCERLLKEEENVVIGIDGFIDPSKKSTKLRNIENLLIHPRFQFINKNLLGIDWSEILAKDDVIYHLAAVPGVRSSWGNNFKLYEENNILVTQRLLEACKNVSLKKFIYASTSSVYGEKVGMVSEDCPLSPLSPYGVTKLTGEYLCKVYSENDGLPITILRYFTVYGPRQRSDMAFHRFIECILTNKPIPIYGDGKQTRDFTFVEDCVEGTFAALYAEGTLGETINIGGKERKSILDVIEILEELTGKKANVEFIGEPRGEPRHTWADISKALKILQYKPAVPLKEGLLREINDLKIIYKEEE
ncbi:MULTISPECIES: NAD-dependent epimerase/dehydratase family protein [Cytobacillus]|uniref:NAD-dependent epimerase/dehydratase family protein n=1 Tax=Cytobacillus TaxID=2675230 RepID=UPI0020421330|nr:NAD-dependent epimerase/dehydratase family protein [Cytobacillus kochii]MCM3324097.1 NAD-dependent epimerase/dehydratase family protein [Cytobacillus kochii]MCM3346499.1 NAD-dependent epimerase/dehydratase family protein [Cytobacillus kochii]MDM5206693.1 NAD-dependent epimerase/dehydratase family protein [Cytobacillus kochii]